MATVVREAWAAARALSVVAARDWHRSEAIAMLADAFDTVAAGDAGTATRRAVALLGDVGWVGALFDPLVAALAADPLFEPPLKVAREDGRTGAILLDVPAARITASVAVPAALAPPASVVMPGQIAVTRYVAAGGARLLRWRAEAGSGVAAPIAAMPLRDGAIVVQDGRRDGHVLAGATAAVTTISVMLRAGAAAATREFACDDGRLLRTASTDDGGSRATMLRTLLRVAGRSDAGDVFDTATREAAAHVRWNAMREWLALDARRALPRLAAMAADDADDEVRALAGRTLAQVRARMAPCPA